MAFIMTGLLLTVAGFQVLLSLGFPLGEFALGGSHKVLPVKLRILSAGNAIVLTLMSFVFLQHTFGYVRFDFIPTTLWIWIITVFLGLNTIANLISPSQKEKRVMTPLSGVMFILSLWIVLT